ncbi:putative NEP-interacting protein, partial [Thalictrum thalictroides]
AMHGKNMEGCFNYLCKGFVQTSKSYSVGVPLKASTYGSKTQLETNHMIFQDRVTGDWWLRNTFVNANIGYWPKALLPELAEGASQVVWGGHAVGQPNKASPPMGNGLFPDGNYRHGSYVRQIKIIDKSNIILDPWGPYYKLESFIDNTHCYNLKDFGYNGEQLGFSFYFGGPGGVDCGI